MADEQRQPIRLPWTGPAQRVARRERPAAPVDWRARCARACSSAPCSSPAGPPAIEARLVYLQVIAARRPDGARRPAADADAQAARQARRDRRPQRPRARLQRRRRHDRRRSLGNRRSGRRRRAQCARRSTGCTADAARRHGEEASPQAAVRLSRPADVAGRSAPGSRRCSCRAHVPQGEPPLLPEHASWRRTSSATSASTTSGLAASSRRTTRRSAAGTARSSSRPTRGATRMSSRVERPATAGAGIELTIDSTCSTSPSASCAPASRRTMRPAAPRSSWIRRRARSSRWRTGRRSIPNTFTAADDDDRRNRAIQTLYEPGSTFKIVTASAALEQHG